MRQWKAFLLTTGTFILTSSCTPELLNALLELPEITEANTSAANSAPDQNVTIGDTSPSAPAPVSQTKPTPSNTTPPPDATVNVPDEAFLGDGFDPAEEGSLGGTTSNNGFNADFSEFLGPEEYYFGPSGQTTNLLAGLTGNDAAGTRVGGPNNVVGVMVSYSEGLAYMTVVNLQNKRTYPVFRSNDETFAIVPDTLNGKPFPSLFITAIPSLTQFTFEHRTSPNPPRCTYYTATYLDNNTPSRPIYEAKPTGNGSCTYF